MIAGHFGFAAGVKGQERQVPLWALMLATVWLDLVFVPLFLVGIETLSSIGTGGYGNVIIRADYTHSLVGALVLSAIFGGSGAVRWGMRTGAVLGGVAFSHWVLDLVVHRPDLPILPGNAGDLPLLGFGLWRWPSATFALELVLVLAGSYLYWRAAGVIASDRDDETRRKARILGLAVLGAGVLTLVADAFAA
ncbi:MAG: permease [Actinomycetota bacterium]|nr:permease [Actinomycetota bacterium]